MRLRYTLLSNDGYLQASHRLEGPPINVVGQAKHATHFVDISTAIARAAALHRLGWVDLSIVPFYL